MLKNLLICYDTRASACSQGLDIQLIVLLTSETSDPPVTHNPTKGNIIGCHLIRINVKAPVRWTRPWNFTVRCKMWFPWKTHLRCENGAETAPDGSAKSAWMFQWICFHWARTKTKQNKWPTEKLAVPPSNMNMPAVWQWLCKSIIQVEEAHRCRWLSWRCVFPSGLTSQTCTCERRKSEFFKALLSPVGTACCVAPALTCLADTEGL